jgi:uncharacterized protein YkwD
MHIGSVRPTPIAGRAIDHGCDEVLEMTMSDSFRVSSCSRASPASAHGDSSYGQADDPGSSGSGSIAGRGSPSSAGSSAPSSSRPSNASSSSPSGGTGGTSSSSGALLDAINRARHGYGLSELKEAPNLDSAAQANDGANVSSGQLAHHNGLIDGSSGEITASDSGGESADQAVQQWLDSPEHRAILLDPKMTQVGVSINGDYSTADFS